jgi:hypothetical protein
VDVTDHKLPTTQEQAKVGNIAAWRARVAVIAFLFPVLFMTFLALDSVIPGGIGWPFLIPLVVLVVLEFGLFGYVSFFLRCPRCSTWIGVGVRKCASCGLKLEIPKESSSARHPDMRPAQH